MIAASWKMNMTGGRTRPRIRHHRASEIGEVELVLCPPFTALQAVHALLEEANLGAQNMHWEKKGPSRRDSPMW
jgi:triosephosphate isomerase